MVEQPHPTVTRFSRQGVSISSVATMFFVVLGMLMMVAFAGSTTFLFAWTAWIIPLDDSGGALVFKWIFGILAAMAATAALGTVHEAVIAVRSIIKGYV